MPKRNVALFLEKSLDGCARPDRTEVAPDGEGEGEDFRDGARILLENFLALVDALAYILRAPVAAEVVDAHRLVGGIDGAVQETLGREIPFGQNVEPVELVAGIREDLREH